MTDTGSARTLLVVGSANADLVVRVRRHPAPGETVLGETVPGRSGLAVHPGGKGANQAVAAGRLGARVGFCGRVGRDPHGELLAGVLREAGVDTAALAVDEAQPSGVALITVAEGGENTIVVAPGANAALTAAEVEAAITAGERPRVVSVQCEVPPEAVRAAALAAPRLVLNPSPPEALAASRYAAEVLARADPLVVNEHEMRALLAGLCGAEGLGGAGGGEGAGAQELLRLGVRSAVVTLGGAGAVLVERGDRGDRGAHGGRGGGRTTRVPAVRVPVVDTTGAGDAFTGALAWRLAEGDGLAAAVGWAVRAGAAAVGEAGAQLSSTACGKLLADRP
ncbi:ribokinase [Streptomyces sp. V4-01]|uniref:Ribokinase n=1 Tax=Actinacidiphila polyblastidii TaxID=3110430 RepID=A0ABU7P5S2_9ACTN|nr:ribokinase [Streptomyces sp. V4-01]